MSLKLIALFLAISLVGCGKPTQREEKYLPSVWTSEDGSKSIDLRSVDEAIIETYNISVEFSTGEICSCDFYQEGLGSSGLYEISSCRFRSGGADPGCSQLNSSGTFRKGAEVLLFCADFTMNSCARYY